MITLKEAANLETNSPYQHLRKCIEQYGEYVK